MSDCLTLLNEKFNRRKFTYLKHCLTDQHKIICSTINLINGHSLNLEKSNVHRI